MIGHGVSAGLDRTRLRLGLFAMLVLAGFVVLFSRLWYLQVLASDEFQLLGRENRVRRLYTDPVRGRIFDRNGIVLVENRRSDTVTIERELLDRRWKLKRVLVQLSDLLDVPVSELRQELFDTTVSPYKPIAVAHDVPETAAFVIRENGEDFPHVAVETRHVRVYPHGRLAAHILGYVGEISKENLKSEHFRDVRPRYLPGDIVGKSGVEYTYDRYLRGTPGLKKVIVDSSGDVIDPDREVQQVVDGSDLTLSLDITIQGLAEQALRDGIDAAQSAFPAPAGAVVVTDPTTGGVVAMASEPTYNPSILADGLTEKEFDALGHGTENNPDDDALINRAIQGQRPPGSTFKVVTAGAAMATGVADPYTQLDCPGAKVYPPEGGPGSEEFNNWTSFDFGSLSFPESLEVSCDTFYYELGWQMEERFGAARGDESERFQKYARTAGVGHETGIDLPNELPGRIPDEAWCQSDGDDGLCPDGWLPGYTVNMAIGQGDVLATPLQMAVTFGAIANGGDVVRPRVGWEILHTSEEGRQDLVREFEPHVNARLPLEDGELSVIQQGLLAVIGGGSGTAESAFAGFPLTELPLAGKTGTSELGETGDLNDAWFVSYGPADAPQYVISVYVEKAGHGGETAAPIARQIWEGIFELDEETQVSLGQDASG